MQYLLLIYNAEAAAPPPPSNPADMEAWMAPWTEYSANLQKAGVIQGGNALQPIATATCVSAVGKPEPVFTDGPFAETREQLGGYYLLECKDLDEALAWAAKCPVVSYGQVEVRPIMNFG